MDAISYLKTVQEFRSQLEVWGVTTAWLWVAGLLALFCLAFSTREVFGWYLRTNQLRDEVRALRQDISRLQETLDTLKTTLFNPPPPETSPDPEKPAEPKSFRLRHWRNSP